MCIPVFVEKSLSIFLHLVTSEKNKYRGGTSDATFRRHSLYIIIIIMIIVVVVVVVVVIVVIGLHLLLFAFVLDCIGR